MKTDEGLVGVRTDPIEHDHSSLYVTEVVVLPDMDASQRKDTKPCGDPPPGGGQHSAVRRAHIQSEPRLTCGRQADQAATLA